MQLVANIPSILLATLTLLLVMVGIAAIFAVSFWLIYRGSTLFLKWLFQREFFIGFRQKCQEWWSRNRVSVIKFWDLISVLIDPVFYGYVLVTLYQRVQAISEYAKAHPQYSSWQLLNLDMESDMQYYIVLLLVFAVWLFAQVWKHNNLIQSERNMTMRLDRVLNGIDRNARQSSKNIRELSETIKALTEEMRRDRENRNEKPPGRM